MIGVVEGFTGQSRDKVQMTSQNKKSLFVSGKLEIASSRQRNHAWSQQPGKKTMLWEGFLHLILGLSLEPA